MLFLIYIFLISQYFSSRSCFLKIISEVETSDWCFVLQKFTHFENVLIHSFNRQTFIIKSSQYRVLVAEKSMLSALKKLVIHTGNIYKHNFIFNKNIIVIL